MFYAALAGTPLIVTPKGVNRVTLVKRVWLYLLAASVAMSWVWGYFPRLQPIDMLVIAFGGYAALSVFWSERQAPAVCSVRKL